jgi:signal transduction histidine kinase
MRIPFSTFNRSLVVFPLVFIAVCTFIFISERAYMKSMDTLDDLHAMGQANVNIQQMVTQLREAEIQMNYFVETGKPEARRGYEQAISNVLARFDLLTEYQKTSPQSLSVLSKLQNLAQSRMTQMNDAIAAGRGGQSSFNAEQTQLEEIRRLRGEWVASEAQYISEHRQSAIQSLELSRIGVVALSVVGVLATFFYLLQTSALERQQLESRRAVQKERDSLELEVANRTVELTQLTEHLQEAIEDERSRLARNLHDDLGALLTSAKLDAARIKARLYDSAPEASELLSHLVSTLNNSIALGRQIIENLRPSALENLGLVATVEILVREYAETSDLIVYSNVKPIHASAETELVVYRILQEAFTNITKYAKATSVWIDISETAEHIEVSVRDDGIGFDSKKTAKNAYGLFGMRFRIEAQGGTLMVISSPGNGTHLQALLPLEPLEPLEPRLTAR